jgi:glycosyltransferase involved in cell wall biosynthesis
MVKFKGQKRHRILYIQNWGGGTATALYDLIQDLDKNLYEPIILLLNSDIYTSIFYDLKIRVLYEDNKSPSLSQIVSNPECTANLQRYSKLLSLTYRLVCALILVMRISVLIRREKISVVHHNDDLRLNRFTVLAAWLAGVPQVCHMHSLSQIGWFEKLLSNTVFSFIYVSKAVEKNYLYLQIPNEKRQVIYNGFNTSVWEQVSLQEIVKIRSEFDVGDDDILISNVGRLNPEKGQDNFLEAIAQVIRYRTNLKVLIVGDPIISLDREYPCPYHQKLQKLILDLNLGNKVIFTGYRGDIPQIMTASDIIVHSASVPEPFGRVIVEGMLAKRPVIATAAGGVLEIIEDRVTGLLAPPQNPSKMAEAILWVINNQEQTLHMREVAQQKAKERFSIEKHVFAVQQVYRTILTGK